MDIKIRKPFDGDFRVSMKFGETNEWYTKITGYPHNGIDYPMNNGTPIKACDKGVIIYADNVPDADGLGINIQHDWGISQYWHLSELIAKYGMVVNKGDAIGKSGATGWATGPHLHFGVKVPPESLPVMRGWANPELYFENPNVEPPNPVVNKKIYLVRPGDNLWKIATKFYGNGKYWTAIYNENRDTISNPNIIRPFQLLKIP